MTAVSPTAGPTGGGTSVVITGTNFTGTTGVGGVKFGATNATSYTVNSNTQITATSPANGVGTYDITVTNGTTSATSSADRFTYVAAPTVTSISPTAGPTAGGTTVIITGTGFSAASPTGAVKFGATNATYVVNSNTQITATSPTNGAGTYDVTVTTAGGTSATSAADQFTHVPAPVVTAIAPTAGPANGGTSVVITGTNLSGATAVTFGGTASSSVVVNSATQITATSPAGSGTVDVRVTTVGGTSATSAADQFTYIPAPTVTAIAPSAGPTGGATMVTITGTNLAGVTAVTFGGAAADGFTPISATQINATSPAGTAGTVDVRVTTVGGTSATSGADQFTYVSPPTISSVTPSSGPTGSSSSVTISGTDLSLTTAITFGGSAGTGLSCSASTCSVSSPTHAAGAVDVALTTPGGTATAAGAFTYLAPVTVAFTPSAITKVGATYSQANAASGGAAGGYTYSLGAGALVPGTSLDTSTGTVSGTPTVAGSFSYIIRAADSQGTPFTGNSSVITATIAKGDQAITLTNPGSHRLDQTPVAISASVNSSLALTFGSSTTGVCTVSGASVTLVATGTCTITADQPGDANWNPAGQQTTSFSVIAPLPVVTSISPASGSTLGGTVVTVTGTGFTGATAVVFGATTASTFTVNSDTQITVTSPAVSPSVADVRVTTLGGTSATSVADRFTFNKADQTISFTSTAPSGAMLGGTTYTPAASATSGGTVVFSIDAAASSVCAISGGVVSFTGVGTCTINANQAGSSVYNPAPQAQQSFAVGKGNQTITFTSTAPSPGLINGATYTPTATATSGGTVVITVDPSSAAVCSMSGGVVHFNAGGTCTLNANQAGDGSYNAAPQAQQVITVSQPTTVPTLAQWAMILLAGLLAAMGVGVGTRRRA